MPERNRLHKYYEIRPDGCWIWIGSKSMQGYGTCRMPSHNKKLSKAHRVVYEAHKGPIPDGKVLDHLCRVKLCVNPDHLEPVTVKQNTIRGNSVKISEEQIANVLLYAKQTTNQDFIARKVGISQASVSRIISGSQRTNTL